MDFAVTEEFARSANVAQLHDEARGGSLEWPASFVETSGGWVYRVDEREDVTIDSTVVQAALDGHVPVWPKQPDVPAFLMAALGDLGKAKARVVMRDYGDIVAALRLPFNYTVALAGIEDVLADAAITRAEYYQIQVRWDEHHLPR